MPGEGNAGSGPRRGRYRVRTQTASARALAVFLLMMTAIMLMLSVASLRAKPAFGLMLLIGAGPFALTGIYQGSLGGGPVIATVAGWIGLPLAVFSLYGGLALMLEDSAQRAHQIEAAEREAGVRRQL